MTINANDAWIYAFLSELSYRRSTQDSANTLEKLNQNSQFSPPNDFADEFAGSSEITDQSARSDSDSRIVQLNQFVESNFSANNQHINTALTYDFMASQIQDENNNEDVTHIWNETGFSAFVVERNGEYTITFRGTDTGPEARGSNIIELVTESGNVNGDFISTLADVAVATPANVLFGPILGNIINEVLGTGVTQATNIEQFLNENGDIQPGQLDAGDWFSNVTLGQGTYLETQFDYARALTQFVIENLAGGNAANVTVTGQSLGGGLAALVGTEFGLDTYTFGVAPFRNQLKFIAERQALTKFRETFASGSEGGDFITEPWRSQVSTLENLADRITNLRETPPLLELALPDTIPNLVTAIVDNFNSRFGATATADDIVGFRTEVANQLTELTARLDNRATHFTSTVEGEFTTNLNVSSGLGRAVQFGGAENIFIETPDNVFNIGGEQNLAAASREFFDSNGALSLGDQGHTSYLIGLAFTQESSARHAGSLHALLLANKSLSDTVEGFDTLLREDDYLRFNIFHNRGVAGNFLEGKLGEDGDPSANAGGQVSVEPLYRLLTNSVIGDNQGGFYNYFSNFFTTIRTVSEAGGENVTGNGVNPTDRNLHNALQKIALQILRDANNEQADFNSFANQLGVNLGIENTDFAGNFQDNGFISLNLGGITSQDNRLQENLGGGFFTPQLSVAYGITDIWQSIHDAISENIEVDFTLIPRVAERFADSLTGLDSASIFRTDYRGIEHSFSTLVVQTHVNQGVLTIDLSEGVNQSAQTDEGASPALSNGAAIFGGDGQTEITGTNFIDYVVLGGGTNLVQETSGTDVIVGSDGIDIYRARLSTDKKIIEDLNPAEDATDEEIRNQEIGAGLRRREDGTFGDTFIGGKGIDIASYASLSEPLQYTLAAAPVSIIPLDLVLGVQVIRDGDAGEHVDYLYGVEKIVHTNQGDTIRVDDLTLLRDTQAGDYPITLFFDVIDDSDIEELGLPPVFDFEDPEAEPNDSRELLFRNNFDELDFSDIGGAIHIVGGYVLDAEQSSIENAREDLIVSRSDVDALSEEFSGESLLGFEGLENVILSEYDDVHFHTSDNDAFSEFGVVRGLGGNDVIRAFNPGFRAANRPVDPDDPDSAIAGENLFLTLDGGEGNDNLFSFGGEGATLIGGAGRDLLFSFGTRGAQLYGNEIDAEENLTSQDESDNFFWSPGAFINDADPVDFLSLFGFPLVGGSNFFTANSGLAIDSLLWFTYYGATTSGQLLVGNLIFDALTLATNPEADALDRLLIVEDYDYAGEFGATLDNFGNADGGIRNGVGDLGLRFRIYGADNGEEISLFNAVWGEVIFFLGQFETFVKGLNWFFEGDPLILDLDGDGIETIRESQSRAFFDFDDDFFAERTGWVGSDDGILAVDLEGDGVIDDISELFGGNNAAGDAPGQRGFAALSEYDSNSDGVIDALDDDFDDILVWRDLDGDGRGEAADGELFTLEELGITSLSAGGTDLVGSDGTDGRVIASGATLLAEGSFTYDDGSVGTIYEAIFETNTARTRYRGDNGLSEWVPTIQSGTEAGTAVNATGRGRSTDLAIAASNDPHLAAVLEAALAQMVWDGAEGPDLLELRSLSGEVISAWAAADPVSRELTPTLTDGNGNLLDYGVYTEDDLGGYWTLNSGADILDAQGNVITRATLEDVVAQSPDWQIEQLWSPSQRSEAVTDRPDAPYLVQLVEGRAQVLDHGIWNDAGGYWELASGTDILDSDGNVIAQPSLEDVLAQAAAQGQEWRVENITFNEFAALPFDTVAVQFIDGIVSDFSVYVEDADGGFHVWARNLDRAIELQEIEGRPGGFSLRNFELDFDTITGSNSTDDSFFRVELLTTEQFRFATALYGVPFQPEILAPEISDDGTISYSVNDDLTADVELESSQSQIDLAIEFFDLLFDVYIPVERGLAVRLAFQGAQAEDFTGLRYDPASDNFVATTDLGLVPFFDSIFEAAPENNPSPAEGDIPEIQQYLRDWQPVLEVIYPDYDFGDLQEVPLLRAILAAHQNTDLDIDVFTLANTFGVDESRLITSDETDSLVLGTDGRDYIYVGAGDQTIQGGQGRDFYILGENFGVDVIEDVEGFMTNRGADTLWFTHLRSDDVFAYKDGNDLVIDVLSTDDQLTIVNQFEGVTIDPINGFDLSDDTEIVTITFADGVVWEERDIALATSHPLDSNDFVLGTEDYDLLDGGLGNDILQGGSDSDVYIFGRGYGVDRIQDRNNEFFQDHIDILQFTGDIRDDDLEFQRLGISNDLQIFLLDDEGNRTGDEVVIENQFELITIPFFGQIWFDRIERLAFEDGSFIDEQEIMARVLENAGTDGNDIIFGFDNDDRLDGGLGNDVLQGFNQDDTYVFGRDYGFDIIEDNSTNFPIFGSPQPDFDTLELTNISLHEVSFLREGDSSTITIQINGTEDQVQITNQFKLTSTILFGDYYFDGVEDFVFADGTRSMFDIAQQIINESSTDGDDIIYGFELNDILDGGEGNDRLEGGIYSDTYIYRQGYGDDVIFDNSDEIFLSAGFDRLDLTGLTDGSGNVIYEGLGLNDVEFGRDGNNLILTVRATGETLTLEEQWNRFEDNRIDWFNFTDFSGSYTLFLPEHFDLVGTNQADTLIGTNYNETIDGRGGDDLLIGLSDGDTYVFDAGYGADVIDERLQTARWSSPDDIVQFGADITVENVEFARVGNDLVITIADRTDSLTILGQFGGGARDGVERFEFSDGTIFSISDVEELLQISAGGRGDDTITGTIDQENVLDGRQGDDTLTGGNLADSYAFGVGYDLDTIIEQVDRSSNNPIDRVVFSNLIEPDALTVSRDGDDLIFTLQDTADQLTIVDGLSNRQVEQFLFADGTVLGIEEIIERLLTGTENADQLIGFDNRDDVLDGGAGPDELAGGRGNDTYIFNLGYGSDAITDTGGFDVIEFGDLIGPQSLLFSADGDNLVIQFVGSDDVLAIRNALGGSSGQIEQLRFNDGSIVEFASILQALQSQASTPGDDVIEGSASSDILVGGQGADLLIGGAGADTYIFNEGDGRDIIDEGRSGNGDVLRLVDYAVEDVSVRRANATNNDVIIEINGSSDQILIRNGLGAEGSSAVEIIEFGNGLRWGISELRERALEASISEFSDSVRGFGTDDVIEAGQGDDFVYGGLGSDTYVFNRLDGRDVIDDRGNSRDVDTLLLRGYLPEEIIITRPNPNDNTLKILFADSLDEILIIEQFNADTRFGLEQIEFGDGTIWNREFITELVTGAGTDSSENLTGNNGENVLVGRGGDDVLSGSDGSDLYIFNRGDGQDIIDDNGNGDTDVLEIRGYATEEIIVNRDFGHPDTLVLTFENSFDEIRIVNTLTRSATDQIEEIHFDDGTIWTIEQVITLLEVNEGPSDGDDVIEGNNGANILDGGLGDDYLSGGDGSDSYLFSRGDGRDVIDDNGRNDTDILIIDGYDASEISFSNGISDNNHLVITFAGTDDQITIVNGLDNSTSDRIEEIRLADGSQSWLIADVVAQIISDSATDGDDRIFGYSSSADTLSGGLGDDYLSGGDGSDSYLFSRGDGRDVIDDNGRNDTDILIIDGYDASEISFSNGISDNNHLVITFAGTDDQITIVNGLDNSTSDRIEEIRLADGSQSWLIADVVGLVQPDTRQDILGSSSNDIIESSDQDDLLIGGGGSDTYIFEAGDGRDVIDDNGFRNTDVLQISGYDAGQVSFGRDAVSTNNVIISFAGSEDQITIRNQFNFSNSDTIERIEVLDEFGIVMQSWSWAELRQLLIDQDAASGGTINGSSSDDIIESSDQDDLLIGGGGSDTYIFEAGDGRDVIDDNGFGNTDVLQISGYDAGQVSFGRDAVSTNNVIISFAGSEDQITIRNQFNFSNSDTIERIEVLDEFGIVTQSWSWAELRQLLIDQDAASGGTINGSSSNDIIESSDQDDLLIGGDGSDTYIFEAGDGRDVIDDNGFRSTDVLQISGFTADQVQFSRDRSFTNDLVITFLGSTDQITVLNGLSGSNADQIERVELLDGSASWTIAEIIAQIADNTSSDANDVINGSNLADTLEGFGGDDILSGGFDGDAYIYVRGDGSDIIEDNGSASGTDTLIIFGYTQDEISFSRLTEGSDDLVIRFADSNATITILNTLGTNTADIIETIQIADDGITLTIDDVVDQLFFDAATDRNDVIFGTVFDDVITGGSGADVIDGERGNDTYVYRAGDGEDRIDDTGNSASDVLQIVDYNIEDIATIRRSPGNGNDIALVFATEDGTNSDIVILEDSLFANNDGVEFISFADGTIWNRDDIRTEILARQGTETAQTIFGFETDDIIEGRGGDDTLIGGDGSDQYIYSAGDGADIIEDNGSGDTDTLIIQGYSSLEASVDRYYLADDGVVITFVGSRTDSITILNTLNSNLEDGIELITFSDGVSWTTADILALLDNNVPVARQDGFFTAIQGAPTLIDPNELVANDFDPDGDPLTIISVSNAVGGFVQINANGGIEFTGDANHLGAASFEYTVSDGNNGLATAVVNVRVRPPATAIDDIGFTVNEDEALTISSQRLLANDIDGDTLILSDVINAIGGTATLSSTGDITFIPAENFNGQASFTYVANSPQGGRAEATVFIDVIPVNDAPDARNDSSFEVLEGSTLLIDALDLLSNDLDIDGDVLTITNVVGDANVTAILQDDGTIFVTPNAFYFGSATLTYTVQDPSGATDTATVNIEVAAVNDAPEPAADSFETDEDTPLFLSTDVLLANDIERDGDTLTVTRVFGASGGQVELFENGTFLFTPRANFFGQARFFYEVDDGQGGTATASVTVQVNPVNDAPEPRGEHYEDFAYLRGIEDQPLIILASDLLANDRDIDSLNLMLQSVTAAVNGDVALDADGNVVFIPDADFFGEASFTYVVADDDGAIGEARVTLFIEPVSDAPPVAVDDSVSIFEDVQTVILAADILANDTDIDGDALTITSVSGIGIGAELDTDGNIVVTPGTNFNGTRFIRYTVSDGFDGTDIGEIAVNVIPVNDAPFAISDNFTAREGSPVVIRISDLLANDFDVEDSRGSFSIPLNFVSAQNTSEGTVSVYADEFVIIEVSDGYSGDFTFDYTVEDSDGAPDSAVVSATVLAGRLETITGTNIRDLLFGSRFDDTIFGLDGNDDIFARDGNDLIIGGDGADIIDGGDGIDRIDYTESNIGIRIDLNSRLGQGGHAQGDLISNVENITTTNFADQIFGDAGINEIEALSGNDLLDGREGNDLLDGGSGNDTLIGGLGADILIGGAGLDIADYLTSEFAINVDLTTGSGLGGDAEGDSLTQIENISGSFFDDTLIGDDADNILEGRRGDDLLLGGAGNDTLIGGQGADIFDGGEGIDTADYFFSFDAVIVDLSRETSGGGDAEGDVFTSIERIHGSSGDDRLIGDDQDNIFRGNDGADVIQGGLGNDTADYSNSNIGVTVNLNTGFGSIGDAQGDSLSSIETLVGSAFNDTFIGSSGDDFFEGGLGNDELQGGLGSDTYYFGFDSGNDVITEIGDASDIDRIVLDPEIRVADISFVREEGSNDLLIEIENDDGFLIDTVLVVNHFLGRASGIDEIVFGDGTIIGYDEISARSDRLNAADDNLRFAFEDEVYVIDWSRILENDTEFGALTGLEIIEISNGINGSAVINSDDQTLEFLSAENFSGIASFDYTVRDEFGRESTATVEVEILPTNDAPEAVNDIIDVFEDQSLLDTSLLIANDFDIDGDSVTVVSVSMLHDESGNPIPTNFNPTLIAGLLFLNLDSNFFGVLAFEYTIADSSGEISTATATLNVIEVNDAPDARGNSVSTREGDAVIITIESLLDNDIDVDGDAISFVSAQGPLNGVIELFLEDENPYILFTPNTGFIGEASFTYTITDSRGGVSTAGVEINVRPQNNPPSARNDNYQDLDELVGIENGQIIIDPNLLLTNDTDPNGDPLQIIAVSEFSENGDVFIRSEDGMIVFTPFENYNGEASFTYTILDGEGGEDTATVTLFIEPLNVGPTLSDDHISRFENDDGLFVITAAEAFANDADAEGDVLFFSDFSIVSIDGNINTSASINLIGDNLHLTGVDEDFFGTIVVEYAAEDVLGGESDGTALITLTVLPQRETASDVSLTASLLDNSSLRISFVDLLQGANHTRNLTDLEGDIFDIVNFGDAALGTYEILIEDGVLTASDRDFDAGSDLTVDIPDSVFEPFMNLAHDVSITSISGGDLPSWISVDGTSLTVDFPKNLTGSYDVLISIQSGPVIQESVLRIFHGNEQDTINGQIFAIEPAETIVLTAATSYDLLDVVSDWPNETFDEEPAFVLIDSNGDVIDTLNITPVIEQDANAGLFSVTDLRLSGDHASLAQAVAEGVALQAIVDGNIVLSEDNILSQLFAIAGNQIVFDGGQQGIAATSPDNQLITYSYDIPADFQIFDTNTQTLDVKLSDGSNVPSWISLTTGEDGAYILTGRPPADFDETGLEVILTIRENATGAIVQSSEFTLSFFDAAYSYIEYSAIDGNIGTDTITYEITDNVDGFASGELVVTVIDGDVPPEANDDDFIASQNQTLSISFAQLLANDTDVDGDSLVIDAVGGAVNGSVIITENGVEFTPDAEFSGEATFQYQINDGENGTDTGTVTINVLPPDPADGSAPIVGNDMFTGTEDEILMISVAELLANDFDPDGDEISFAFVEFGGINASATTIDGETIFFTPSADFFGSVDFTYTVTDGTSTASGVVTIDFASVNDAPVAIDDMGFITAEDTPLIIDPAVLLANDRDIDSAGIEFVSVSAPSNGTVDLVDGQIIFTGFENYFGNAQFDYTIIDSEGLESTATVFLSITPENDLPVAVNDTGYVIDEEGSLTLDIADILENDRDPDGDDIAFDGLVSASGVSVVDNGDGTLTFTGGLNFYGPASFTYQIRDAEGLTDTATVSIDVLPVDDVPIAGTDTFNTDEDVAITIPILSLLSNDTDPDGNNFQITAFADGEGGTVSEDGAGNVIFTPTANFNGLATFTYTLTDSTGSTSTGVVRVNVASVNDAPIINIPLSDQSFDEDTDISIIIPANTFTDIDGDDLTLTIGMADGSPLVDWLTFENGVVTGTPPANFNGVLDIVVTANDGSLSVSDSFSLTINAINDAPIDNIELADQNFDEDSFVEFSLPANAFADVDGDMLTLAATLPEGHPLPEWLSFDGVTFSGTPPQNFFGALEIIVTASDGELSFSSTFNLNINSVNDAPIAINDVVDATEDTVLIIPILDLLTNDFDVENNSFQLTEVFDATNGTVSLDGLGNVIFTPDANYFGPAQFTYRVVDIFGGTNDAIVSINIESVNDAPDTGVDLQDISIPEEAFVNIEIPTDAFIDVDGDSLNLTATLTNGAALPAWLIFENGTLTGTPPNNFNGRLEIAIIASDGQLSRSQSFTLEVTPVNDSPILTIPLSNRFVVEDADFDVALQDAFIDPEGDELTLSATQVDGSALPDWIRYDAANNRLTGRPPQDFVGTIAVLITASDGVLSVSDSFDFTVVNTNDAPNVVNPVEDLIVEEDSFIDYAVPFEDIFFDIDGDALSYAVISADGSPLPEWLSFENGSLSGQPPQDFNGDIALTLIANDGLETIETSFNIQVTSIDDVPIANDDFGLTVNAGGAVVFSEAEILGNDVDPDNIGLTFTGFGEPENGELIRDDLGNFVYTPDARFAGVDSFTYTVENDTGSAEANVFILVEDNYLSFDVQGTAANDILFGDIFARNSIYGNAGNDIILGGFRNDELAGGAGNDLIISIAGNNFIDGGAGNDRIFGGLQNDRLSGGTGRDILFGGLGQDTFEFAQGDGIDIIRDFNRGVPRRNLHIAGDRIEIDYAGIDDFTDLLDVASQEGRSTIFDFGNGDMLILNRTRLASLDDDVFTFV